MVKNGLVTGAVLLALVLILSSISLACGANPATVPPTSPPLPTETPSSLPPTSTDLDIPADYTTYTGEAQLFSISYPAEWETALSLMSDIQKERIESWLKSGVYMKGVDFIFMAGRRTATGYEPNINIVVQPMPEGISTHDQMVEGAMRGTKMGVPRLSGVLKS